MTRVASSALLLMSQFLVMQEFHRKKPTKSKSTMLKSTMLKSTMLKSTVRISMNESAERPKIPRQLTDRFTNLTRENWEFSACRSWWYLFIYFPLCIDIQVGFITNNGFKGVCNKN